MADPRLDGTEIADSVTELIGNTPIVRLRRMMEVEQLPCVLAMKMETTNPGGSSKDRPALEMILAAERDGSLRAGRHDRRTDERQHRCRPGDRRRPARLQVRVRDDRQDGAREGVVVAGVRRRGRRVPGRRSARRSAELLQGRRAADRRARRVPPQPVRQPEQPGGPREDDGTRAVAPDGRAHHPLRRRRRHVRLAHRHGALPQGAEPGDQDHRRRPGGLGVLGWLRSAVPGRRCRRGLLPGRVGARAVRRGDRDQRRGELPHRPARQPGRGHPDRWIRRHGRGRRDQGGEAGRTRRHRRGVQPRLRPRLPLPRVRRRVDGELRVPARVRPVRRGRARHAQPDARLAALRQPQRDGAGRDRADARQRCEPVAGLQEHPAVRGGRDLGIGRRARADGGDLPRAVGDGHGGREGDGPEAPDGRRRPAAREGDRDARDGARPARAVRADDR